MTSAIGILWLVVALATPSLAAADDFRAEGAKIYARYCEGCHGPKGDGHGWPSRSAEAGCRV